MINRSDPPGHNRDYFTRPLQGDRQRSDYGHTRLTPDGKRGTIRGYLLMLILFGLVVLMVAALSTL